MDLNFSLFLKTLRNYDWNNNLFHRDLPISVLALLSKIGRKLNILFGISNFDLEQKEDEARNLYHTYVSNYNSGLIVRTDEEEQIGKFSSIKR